LTTLQSSTEIRQTLWRQTVDEVVSSLGLQLSPEWQEVIYDDSYAIVAMGGEGAAKSFHAGLLIVCHLFYDPIVAEDAKLYWIVGADFEDAQKEFRYVHDFLSDLDYIEKKSMPGDKTSQWWLVTKGGQRIETISAYDPTKIAREDPQGVVGAEFTRMSREAFDRCIGRTNRRMNKHSWGFYSGSYETSLGWLPDMVKQISGPNQLNMRAFRIPSWANLYYYPGGRQDPAILLEEQRTSPSRFMERFGAEPQPPQGIIFSEFRNTTHVDPYLKYDTEYPVYVFIDPGDTVYCVLFIQLIDGEVRVLEEIYVAHWTHSQVINEVKNKVGWPLVTGGAIDVAAKQAHMGLPRPIVEWRKDTGITLSAKRYPIEDSIDIVRLALAINPRTNRPRFRVHPSCTGIISEMGGGSSPVEDGGPWLRTKGPEGFGPPKGRNDHACKALGYGLQSRQLEFTGSPESREEAVVSYMGERHTEGSMQDFMNWFKDDDETN
jgi:hypothetical protein